MKLKTRIEREYKKACKGDYKNKDGFKLAMLFCAMLPNADVNKGFPDSLLTDTFELFYEFPATDEFHNDENMRLSYMDFIETAIKNGTPKRLIFDIFDGLYDGLYTEKGGYSDLFKPLTKQYYDEYLTKWRKKSN